MPGPLNAGHRLSAVQTYLRLLGALSRLLLLLHDSSFCGSTCRASVTTSFLRAGQMTELGHGIAIERAQNPANPSGLLYGIATLVTSSSEPSGLVAYPTSFDAFP